MFIFTITVSPIYFKGEIFADFEILSQAVKMKYFSKHTFNLRNALSQQKLYHEIKKTVKKFTLEIFRLYTV